MHKYTFDEFLSKARQKHGDKYEYDESTFVNSNTLMKITCPEHGEFWQRPANHLQGRGCHVCSGRKQHTIEEFIEKAKEIHGNQYDYSKVEYTNNRTPVIILCPKHGEFKCRPTDHIIKKCGCPKCKAQKQTERSKYTQEEFIKMSNEIHHNKYDYSEVEYTNTKTPVKIICPIHGEFYQKPHEHLKGHECAKCGREKANQSSRSTTEEFIEKAVKVHGDKYDYSLVDYKSSDYKVKIICRKHGVFEQNPANHLQGAGCFFCGQEKIIQARLSTTEEFINKAKAIHGDKYDYSLVEYKDCKTPVKIMCSVHGIFDQTPQGHLSGHGCPKCNYKNQYILFDRLREEFPDLEIVSEASYLTVPWIGRQRFDIYFPLYNIAVEYNGIQHYQPHEYLGGESGYQECLRRDQIKRQKCKDNNCLLIEVKYDYDEDRFREVCGIIKQRIEEYS